MAKNFLVAALTTAVVALTLAGCSAPSALPSGGAATSGTESQKVDLVSELGADDIVGTWITGESYDTPIKPFLSIAADGTWLSSDGCNGGGGTWKLGADGALTATAGPENLVYCPGVSLSSVIAGATELALDGESLVFSGAESGSTTLQRTDDPSYGPPVPLVGHWAETAAADSSFIDFAADGTFVGMDGCNYIGGSWTRTSLTATLVVFTNVVSTAMACDEADDRLGSFDAGTISGNVMTLSDDHGIHTGTLTAASAGV